MNNKKSTQHHPKTSLNLNKLQHLIHKLKQVSEPIADDLQSYSLLISQTISNAIQSHDLFIKKVKYRETLNYVQTVIKLLADIYSKDDLISNHYIHLIYQDLLSLENGLNEIIFLLSHPMLPAKIDRQHL